MIALSEIGENELMKIEGHINTHVELINNLKCCYSKIYKTQETFQFLPGHKAIILGIKNQIQKFKEHRSQNPNAAKKTSLKKNLAKERSADELKSVLVKSLQAYLAKHALQTDILSARNIINFEEKMHGDRKTYRCEFSCLFCHKVIPVLYNTFWMNSNVTKHLRGHIAEGNYSASYEEVEIDTVDEFSYENLS